MRNYIALTVMRGCAILAAPTLSHASYTQTRHPVVLVHGVTGFNTIGGLGHAANGAGLAGNADDHFILVAGDDHHRYCQAGDLS